MHRVERWDDLRYFLAVARRGGLSPAARDLGVNQSTVYRRVARLEEALGARLFDRQARGYALTAVGEEMMALVTRVEDDVMSIDRLIGGADRELRGTVRVTTVDEVLERVAPHLLAFRERYPGIDVEVNSDQRVLSLTRRETDVAIRPGVRPTEAEVLGRKLVALPMAAFASATYLEGRPRPRGAPDLPGHSFIGFSARDGGGQQLRELAGDVRVAYRSNSMTSQAIAARAGLGIALLPRFVGDPDPHLERLFTIGAPSAYHLWLLIHADLRQTARVRAFVDFMTEAIFEDRAVYEGSEA